jgi:hypothetical protein
MAQSFDSDTEAAVSEPTFKTKTVKFKPRPVTNRPYFKEFIILCIFKFLLVPLIFLVEIDFKM